MYEENRHNLYDILEEINDSCSEVDHLVNILADIVNLHNPYYLHNGSTLASCDGCGQLYPCATINKISKMLMT